MSLLVPFGFGARCLEALDTGNPKGTESYSYWVEVEKTRQIPAYNYETQRVRVAPFTRKVTAAAFNYENRRSCHPFAGCSTVRVRVAPFTKKITVAAYNYETKKVRVAPFTRPHTYTGYEKKTGTRQVHDAHYEPPPAPAPTAAPKPPAPAPTAAPQPTGKPLPPAPQPPAPAPTAAPQPTGKPLPPAPQPPAPTPPTPREGGTAAARPCPSGQTKAHAIYSRTPNRLLTGYADLPSAPDGHRWNLESANSDYACYRAVLKTPTGIDAVLKGAKAAAKAAARTAVAAGKSAKDAASEGIAVGLRALETAGTYTYRALCATAPGLSLGAGANASLVAGSALAARNVANAALIATGVGGATSLVVGAAITTACTIYPPERLNGDNNDDDDGDNDDDDTTSSPPPPPPTATATPDPNAPPADYSEHECHTYGSRTFCYYKTPGGWVTRQGPHPGS